MIMLLNTIIPNSLAKGKIREKNEMKGNWKMRKFQRNDRIERKIRAEKQSSQTNKVNNNKFCGGNE